MTNDATTEAPQAEEPSASRPMSRRLLELMAHSVYSERDVFLRELISNAADACEKLRYESLSDEALAGKAQRAAHHHHARQGQAQR